MSKLNFSEATLQNTVVHRVGNRSAEEGITFSHKPLELTDDLVEQLMMKYFLYPFQMPAYYNFTHDTDLELNEVFTYAKNIFENPDKIFERSISIAKHLYNVSNHPKIKAGEFYVVYLRNCIVADELVDGIGLFKTENKDAYLRVTRTEENFEMSTEEGININKLDKGCIIFNTERQSGYLVAITDGHNSNEALYWKKDFLKVKPCENNFFKTKKIIEFTNSFIDELANESANKNLDRANMKNKAQDYFKNNQEFISDDFVDAVTNSIENRKRFDEHKRMYETDNDIDFSGNFEIDENVVKSSKKFFKAVMKLDKNFHLYVHGNSDLIERGFDEERKMSYYKLFYTHEE